MPARDVSTPDERRSERAGFGLLELLVAITVASIVLLGVGVAQSVCYDLGRTSQETLTAASDLESAMEGLLLLSPPEMVDPDGPFAPDQPVAEFEGLHLEGERIVTSYPNLVDPDDLASLPDPLQIRLTLTFQDYAGRARSMTIASLKTR